jgi:hypothetical protein
MSGQASSRRRTGITVAQVATSLTRSSRRITRRRRTPQAKGHEAMTATTNPATRKSLTLNRPVKNTLDGSTVVQAKRSPQVHVLPDGTTVTLCNINTAKWAEQVTVEDGAKVTCPLCAKALKA